MFRTIRAKYLAAIVLLGALATLAIAMSPLAKAATSEATPPEATVEAESTSVSDRAEEFTSTDKSSNATLSSQETASDGAVTSDPSRTILLTAY